MTVSFAEFNATANIPLRRYVDTAPRHSLSAPVFMWVLLWLGVNTGPWAVRQSPTSLIALFHYARTVLPAFILIVCSVLILHQGIRLRKGDLMQGPLRLWLIYGLLGLIVGCVESPKPLDASYWAIVYLCAFVCAKSFLQDKNLLSKAVFLNYLTWILTTIVLVSLIIFSREVLFIDTRWGLSGYGVVERVGTVSGMAMSRSSGMARFAAVPALVAFVLLLGGKGFKRVAWAMAFAGSLSLVYLMQSRGAILGVGFAVGFILVLLGKRTRIIGGLFLIVFGFFTLSETIPEKRIEFEKERFYRGISEERLYTLTGRTLVWKLAWQRIKEAPILGYGPQSDRWLLKAHVHNTYLYAMLQGGVIGASAFAGGLIWAWVLFFKAILRKTADKLGQRVFLIQAGGILAFFTVRSIPEVSGAMFGVDFLVMLPILAYLTILDQHGAQRAVALRTGAGHRAQGEGRFAGRDRKLVDVA